jgi:hypothetical protein
VRPALQAMILASLVLLGLFAQTQRHERSKYDGQWWLSVSPKEHDGFVSGYYDCYTYEYKGPDKYTAKSFSEYGNLITGYYKNDAAKQGVLVSEAMHELRDRPGEKASPGGETTPDKHGYFDGLYWKQISALGGKEKQVGFVEGYLSCHAELVHNKGAVFSKPAEEYAALITQWYGFKEDTGDIDEKREPIKVADALFQLRDHAPNHEQAKSP